MSNENKIVFEGHDSGYDAGIKFAAGILGEVLAECKTLKKVSDEYYLNGFTEALSDILTTGIPCGASEVK